MIALRIGAGEPVLFAVRQAVRADAAATIAHLKRAGYALEILSGDGPGAVDSKAGRSMVIRQAGASGGWPIAAVRTGIELSALVGGWLLGGTVGVGTILFAFGIGPLVHVFLPRLTV